MRRKKIEICIHMISFSCDLIEFVIIFIHSENLFGNLGAELQVHLMANLGFQPLNLNKVTK